MRPAGAYQEVMDSVQGAGIAPGVVQGANDLRIDPQYEYRAFFSRHHRREVGSSWYAAHPYSINDQPQGAQRVAPCLGEYGEEVLGDVLGLSQ